MRRSLVYCLLLIALIGLAVRPLRAEITAEEVRKSIQRGVDYLKSQQNKVNGSWPARVGQPGGVTALCTLALIYSGVEPSDEAVQRALAYLRKLGKPKMVYTTALQTMVFCAAEPEKDLLLIRRNAAWLQSMQITTRGESQGAWAYSDSQGSGDRSNSQFALLALHEAERAGVSVNERTWRLALRYWLNTQHDDGSWNYQHGYSSTGSMTCAGIASLVIASGQLSRGDARVVDSRIRCCGEQEKVEEIERAFDWLGNNFSVRRNPTGPGKAQGTLSGHWLLYYLYGVERVGRLTGRRHIGPHDWYREGAEYLVRMQDGFTGRWKGKGHAETEPCIATPFALLFLSKGRRPVLVAKLKHGASNDWNRHRSDTANLTRYVERQWKRDLTWQVIDVRAAGVEDLLQAPVLLITGREAVDLTAEQKKNLRRFVDQGGFIFAVANTDGTAFAKKFKSLMKELFPDSPLRPLPQDHPIWLTEKPVDPQQVPLYGIDACCRTSVVFCPKDLSCLWELSQSRRDAETDYPKDVQARIDAANAIGANVLAYATGRELKEKLDQRAVDLDDENTEALLRGTVSVVKLRHSGGSDDAPAALRNLLRVVGNEMDVRVSTKSRLLNITDEALSQHPIVFMHGRRRFSLTSTQRKALATYIDRGGFLLVDSICASRPFADSLRREMKIIFPDAPLGRIPVDHPIFSGKRFRGYDLSTVTLRDPQARTARDPLRTRLSKVAPLLEGIEIDGRYVVIFSPYDISCALENSPSIECKGYVRSDAAKIGTNVILYALQQ